jgi:hypothetical protein
MQRSLECSTTPKQLTGQTAWHGASVQCMQAMETERSPGLPSLMVEPTQQLTVDLTIQGARIFYRDTSYQFSNGMEALIFAITREVEQFLKPR